MIVTNSEINNLLYHTSPDYLRAYEDGYNACKKEMLDALKRLQALHETTATIGATNER